VCDEPTGSLDYKSKISVLELLRSANKELKITVIIATHDQLAEKYATRTVRIVDGAIREA